MEVRTRAALVTVLGFALALAGAAVLFGLAVAAMVAGVALVAFGLLVMPA